LHFAPELAEATFAAATNLPTLSSIHDRVGEHLYPEVMSFPWAHTIFASYYLKANLPSCEPSSVRWLGVELKRFRPKGTLDRRLLGMEKPIIFHPARLLRWKGVEVGLEAFTTLRKRIGSGTLVMCSSENAATDQEEIQSLRRSLTDRARENGVVDHVRFLEFTLSEIPAAYRASDMIWYPTIDEEPLGLVPLEAMACGVPLIVSDSGGMRETVINGETGLVVPKSDTTALAAAAERLLSDRDLQKRVVASGLHHIRSFDNARYTERLVSLYERVLARTSQQ
jgi:glycosyltransferase involved in cell wall biosynthesis